MSGIDISPWGLTYWLLPSSILGIFIPETHYWLLDKQSLINDINIFDYKALTYNIDHLQEVLEGKSPVFVWGGRDSEFFTQIETTTLEDMVMDRPTLTIDTTTIVDILLQRKVFTEKFSKKTDLFTAIKNGFIAVSQQPNTYLYDSEFNRYLYSESEELNILYVLDDKDLIVNVDEFMNSIHFVERFFCFDSI